MDLYNIITGNKPKNIRVFNQNKKILKNKKNSNIITKLKKRKLKVKNIWKFDPMDADDNEDKEDKDSVEDEEEKDRRMEVDLNEAISTANKDAFIGEFWAFGPVKEIRDKIWNLEKDIDKDKKEIDDLQKRIKNTSNKNVIDGMKNGIKQIEWRINKNITERDKEEKKYNDTLQSYKKSHEKKDFRIFANKFNYKIIGKNKEIEDLKKITKQKEENE